jgi:hypothetical protein
MLELRQPISARSVPKGVGKTGRYKVKPWRSTIVLSEREEGMGKRVTLRNFSFGPGAVAL